MQTKFIRRLAGIFSASSENSDALHSDHAPCSDIVHGKRLMMMHLYMTVQVSGKTTLFIAGSGTITIDWGDGTKPDCFALSPYDLKFSDRQKYSHVYSDVLQHCISISGHQITHLCCMEMCLTSLITTPNMALMYVDCRNNNLTELDISQCFALTELFCSGNRLTEIDLNQNYRLKYLSCFDNELTHIDVNRNSALIRLYCYNNRLNRLNVTRNTALTFLNCAGNLLSADAMDALFGTLNQCTAVKSVTIDDNPGTTHCNRHIAQDRGWKVYTNDV